MNEPLRPLVRAGLILLCATTLIVGLGFLFRAEWALGLWPIQDGPLSYRFIASILLAQATALAWTAVTLELNYARGGAIGYTGMFAGFALFAAGRYRESADPLMLGWIVVCGVLGLNGVILFFLGARYPKRDQRPIPELVRWSNLVLGMALIVATVMLLSRAKVIFPWPLKPETSILFGLFYFSSITYMLDAWWRPAMGNTLAQLGSFLVYDLVLIPPYLQHWGKAQGGFRISLMIYLVVLFGSAALAVWVWAKHWRGRGNPAPAASR